MRYGPGGNHGEGHVVKHLFPLALAASLIVSGPAFAQDRYDLPPPAHSDLMGRDTADLAAAVRWRVEFGAEANTWKDASTLSFGFAQDGYEGFEYGGDIVQLHAGSDIDWSFQTDTVHMQDSDDPFGISTTAIIVTVVVIALVIAVSNNNSGGHSGSNY